MEASIAGVTATCEVAASGTPEETRVGRNVSSQAARAMPWGGRVMASVRNIEIWASSVPIPFVWRAPNVTEGNAICIG